MKFLLLFCSTLLCLLLSVVATGQNSMLPEFDEEKALLELKEVNPTREMIDYYLMQKKKDFYRKLQEPADRTSETPFLKSGNSITQANFCENLNFESGDFSNWQGSTGYHPSWGTLPCVPFSNPICPQPGIVNTQHTIMSGTSFDPWVGPALPTVAPGGNFSVRLGNDNIGGEAEQLTTTFKVGQSHFTYRYAVVLDDPIGGHSDQERPFFKIDVYETATGSLISCAQYFVIANEGIPGFQTVIKDGKTIRWKQWTSVTLDLSNFMNQDITIRFTTSDCSLGVHFGYAYLDCSCENLFIAQQDKICPGDSAVLEAPEGFEIYNWKPTNANGQRITTNVLGTHTVTMTNASGCVSKATHSVELLPGPDADFSFLSSPTQLDVYFNDLSSALVPLTIVSWNWDFGDGNSSTQQNPHHFYNEIGRYIVTLKVEDSKGCVDSISKDILIQAYTLYVPNAFTPDGDNHNDFFNCKATGVEEYEMWIFDRWGNLIFNTTHLDEAWDGRVRLNGSIAQQDIYVWKIATTTVYAKQHVYYGHVALIR